ncbi:MAG TPA: HTH domain-containing protein, partial [Ignavibacteria bacterium]|nr:HTH domain-containing protein [Ignavibacteria bacterium]
YEIIKQINSKQDVTVNELSTMLGVTRLTIIRDLKKLRELNLIRRVGSDKTGYWEVVR